MTSTLKSITSVYLVPSLLHIHVYIHIHVQNAKSQISLASIYHGVQISGRDVHACTHVVQHCLSPGSLKV